MVVGDTYWLSVGIISPTYLRANQFSVVNALIQPNLGYILTHFSRLLPKIAVRKMGIV